MLKVIVSSNFIYVATESKEHIPVPYLPSISVHLHPTGVRVDRVDSYAGKRGKCLK